MTAEVTLGSSLAAEVSTSLESPRTVTKHTLHIIRDLFGIDRNAKGIKAAPKRPQSAKQVRGPASKSTGRPLAQATKDKASLPSKPLPVDDGLHVEPLPPSARCKLATKVFNCSLRCLTEIAREEQKHTPNAPNPNGLCSSQNGRRGPTPLQQRSPNRQVNQFSSTICSGEASIDVEALSDCAGVAIHCLQDLDTAAQTPNEAVATQHEQGSLMLLDKLISLRMVDRASSHAISLISHYRKRRKQACGPVSLPSGALNVHLLHMIAIDARECSRIEFGFLTSLQSQLLRLSILLNDKLDMVEFFNQVKYATVGSPTMNVVEGHRRGLLDKEKAGLQLRTISQALIKLYSIHFHAKSQESKSARTQFSLLAEALQVKCKSWSFLKHSPVLDQEIWTPLMRAAKKSIPSESETDPQLCRLVTERVDYIISALQEDGHSIQMSDTALIFFMDLSERCGDFSRPLKWLAQQDQSPGQDLVVATIISWRKAILMSNAHPKEPKSQLSSLQTAFSNLKELISTKSTVDGRLLVYMARLRKLCLTIGLDERPISDKAKGSCDHEMLRKCSCDILIGLVRLSKQLLTVETSTCGDKDKVRKSGNSNMLTTVSKTVEAILLLTNLPHTQQSMPKSELDAGLEASEACLRDLSKDVCKPSVDQMVSAFVQGLCVRLSDIFWQRYVHLSDESDSSATEMDRSISIVAFCSPQHQKKAAIGTKLERKGATALRLNNPEVARLAFRQAIQHYISLGALQEAAEVALADTSWKTWSISSTARYSLGRCLVSYAKIILNYDPDGSNPKEFFYDDKELSSVERCVLLEAQILSSGDHPFNPMQVKALQLQVDLVLELSSSIELHVYRLRFAHNFLRLAMTNSSLPRGLILKDARVRQLCAPDQDAADGMYLATFYQWLKNSFNLQNAVESGELNTTNVSQYVACLSSQILNFVDKDALNLAVDDISFSIKQIEFLLACCQTLEHVQSMQECLRMLIHLLERSASSGQKQHIAYLHQLGQLYNRLDMINEAKTCFANARLLLTESVVPSIEGIKCSLAYVDYLLNVKDIAQAEEVFRSAHSDFSLMYSTAETVSGRQRLDRDAILARSAIVASKIALSHGDISQACEFSQRAVKTSAGIWQAVHQFQAKSSEIHPVGSAERLNSNMSSLAVSSPALRTDWILQFKGTSFGDFCDLHHLALWRTALLSMHNGLFQDALCYTEQLRKISSAAGSFSWRFRADSLFALLHAVAGRLEIAVNTMQGLWPAQHAKDVFENSQAVLLLVEALSEIGQQEEAKRCLAILSPGTSHRLDSNRCDPENTLPNESTKTQKPTSSSKRTTRQPTRKIVHVKPKAREIMTENESTSNQDYIRGSVFGLEVLLDSDIEHNLERATDPSRYLTDGRRAQNPIWRPAAAQKLLDCALSQLSTDAVKCVLAESAIAFPVQAQARAKSSRVLLLQADQSPIKATTKQGKKSAGDSEKASPRLRIESGEKLLLAASGILPTADDHQVNQLSCSSLHLTSQLRSKLSLLSSALEAPFGLTALDLVLQNLHAKDLVRQRELATAKAENNARQKEQAFAWPNFTVINIHHAHPNHESEIPSISDLAALPVSWTLISISLSSDRKELLLSKLNAEKSPFILRIPLSRSDLEVQTESDFTFEDAKAELDTIITKANALCHDKRGQGDRKTRQIWFDERQSLDHELADWLMNIENIWLGGFRGVLGPGFLDESTILMFHDSLSKALDAHLPSRRRPGSQNDVKAHFHANVMELFLALGHPDKHDLDDAVTDLLYFVVDILQFRGERNAYDEIDFDALAVDVLDALRACHEKLAQHTSDVMRHLILILDKELEFIPWESLPCLRGHSISRMPSVVAVLQRVKEIRSRDISAQGYVIAADQGAYMLNPSSDLTSTESTFHDLLKTKLPNAKSMVRKVPSEDEFAAILHDHELFLYFGHGSGAQYIRGRTIRGMDSCAVTLLMGCSSAKMTQCGKMESYGMPGYYVGGMSGCMAMVGTLWDVTDRDIDRFAMKLMVEWGLIDEDESVRKALERSTNKSGNASKAKTNSQARVKSSKKSANQNRGKISLGEAVSNGRDACVLRYLNGAAPVIYGVPVFLK